MNLELITYYGVRDDKGPGIYAVTDSDSVWLAQWWESKGNPPEMALGWGADPLDSVVLAARVMLEYSGWPLDSNPHECYLLAQDVLCRLPYIGWQVDETSFTGYLCCRPLLQGIGLLGLAWRPMTPSLS
jgi:hypothetical protein